MREQSKLLWEQEDCVTCFLPIILPHFQYCLPQFDPLSSLCFFSSFHLPFHSSLYYSLHPSNVLVYFHFTLSCAVPSFLVFSSSLQPPSCVFSFPFHHSLFCFHPSSPTSCLFSPAFHIFLHPSHCFLSE